MPFKGELFLAWKYLKPQKNLLSLLTYLSLLGPILGVAVLLVVTSVMNGMPKAFVERLMEYNPHITMQSPEPLEFADDQVAYIEKNYNLKVSPITSLKTFVQKGSSIHPFKAKGIYPPKYVTKLRISNGFEDITDTLKLKMNDVLLSTNTAYKNRFQIGDKLILHSPTKYKEAIKTSVNGQLKRINMNSAKAFKIAGFYQVLDNKIDEQYIIIHQDSANEMLSYNWGAATSLEITLDDPHQAAQMIVKLQQDPQFKDYKFTPWMEQSRGIYKRIKREKLQMSFVLFLIVGAAGIGIGACIFSLVVQKTKEIGVLKAIGTSPLSIIGIFMSQGAFIGVFGSAIGYFSGLAILNNRAEVVSILGKFGINMGNLKSVPMYLDPTDVQMILWGAIVTCLLAATIPAIIAASVNPVKALQGGS